MVEPTNTCMGWFSSAWRMDGSIQRPGKSLDTRWEQPRNYLYDCEWPSWIETVASPASTELGFGKKESGR